MYMLCGLDTFAVYKLNPQLHARGGLELFAFQCGSALPTNSSFRVKFI